MVGWSRGGVIVATVAEDLNTVKLTTTGFTITPRAELSDSIPVHWVGLFDAVNRMGATWGGEKAVPAPNNPWAWRFTTNVVAHDHLVKTTLSLRDNDVNHTVMNLKPTEELPYDKLDVIRRHWLTHKYIGTSVEALQWMIKRARTVHVPVKRGQ
jgi:hypothetical protein